MQMTNLRLLTSRKKLIFNEKPKPFKYELATIPARNFRSLLASRDPADRSRAPPAQSYSCEMYLETSKGKHERCLVSRNKFDLHDALH